MHYCYILFLKITKQLYVGSTRDLKRRIGEHKLGKVRSTNKRDPVLIHCESYLLESDAVRRESFLKTTEGKRLIKQQLRDILRQLGYL